MVAFASSLRSASGGMSSATSSLIQSSSSEVDGFFLEYFGVLLEDATHQAGPAFLQEASVYNVEKFFGWVSNTADFCGTIGQAPPPAGKTDDQL